MKICGQVDKKIMSKICSLLKLDCKIEFRKVQSERLLGYTRVLGRGHYEVGLTDPNDLQTLCHEMIHVQQFETKNLILAYNGDLFFKGKKVSKKESALHEVDARERETILYREVTK